MAWQQVPQLVLAAQVKQMDQIDRAVFPHPGSRGSQVGSLNVIFFSAWGGFSGLGEELLTYLPVWREMVNGYGLCLFPLLSLATISQEEGWGEANLALGRQVDLLVPS